MLGWRKSNLNVPHHASGLTALPSHRGTHDERFEAARAGSSATRLRVPQVMQDGVPDEDAENAGKGGCGLGGNLDVAICRADWHLHKGEHQVCASADSIEATPKNRASFGGLPQMTL